MCTWLQKCGKCLSIFFYRSRVWRRLRKVKVLIYTDCSGSIDFLFECLSCWAFNWHPLPWSFSACLNGSSAWKTGVTRKIQVNMPCWCTVPACFAPCGWCLSSLGVFRRQHWECSGLSLEVGHLAMLWGEVAQMRQTVRSCPGMVHWLLPDRGKIVPVSCAYLAVQLNFILELGFWFRQNLSCETHAICTEFLIRRVQHGHLSLVIMYRDRD